MNTDIHCLISVRLCSSVVSIPNLLLGPQSGFKPPPEVVVILDKTVEGDYEGNLKRRRVVCSPLEFFGIGGPGLNALELFHHLVNVLAAWMAVIAVADQRERKPIDDRLHLIRVVERQPPHQERIFGGLGSFGEFKDLGLKVVWSGAHRRIIEPRPRRCQLNRDA